MRAHPRAHRLRASPCTRRLSTKSTSSCIPCSGNDCLILAVADDRRAFTRSDPTIRSRIASRVSRSPAPSSRLRGLPCPPIEWQPAQPFRSNAARPAAEPTVLAAGAGSRATGGVSRPGMFCIRLNVAASPTTAKAVSAANDLAKSSRTVSDPFEEFAMHLCQPNAQRLQPFFDALRHPGRPADEIVQALSVSRQVRLEQPPRELPPLA